MAENISQQFPGVLSSPVQPGQAFANASPIDREEAGFFSNPLETIASVFGVPQQILYAFGKNMGEFLSGNELNDDNFFDDVTNAVRGRGNLTFKNLLETVGLEGFDAALPEGMAIDNLAARIPISAAAGLLAGFGSGNPFIGFTVGFSANDFLAGKGAVSSVVDIATDPANKLRLFQRTAKGLNMSQEEFLKLSRTANFADEVAKKADELPLKGSLLSQFIRGERVLFDFKGNSGFLVTPGNKFLQGMGLPVHREMFDVGRWTGVNLFAETLDTGIGIPMRTMNKIFGTEKVDDLISIADSIEARTIRPVTNLIARKIGDPIKSVFQVGAETGMQTRKDLLRVSAQLSDPERRAFFSEIMQGDLDEYDTVIEYTEEVSRQAAKLLSQTSSDLQAAQAFAKRQTAGVVENIEQSRLLEADALRLANTSQKVLAEDGASLESLEELFKSNRPDDFSRFLAGAKLNAKEIERALDAGGVGATAGLPQGLALDAWGARVEDVNRQVSAEGMQGMKDFSSINKELDKMEIEIDRLKQERDGAERLGDRDLVNELDATISDRENKLKAFGDSFLEKDGNAAFMQGQLLQASDVEKRAIANLSKFLHPDFFKRVRLTFSGRSGVLPEGSTEALVGEAYLNLRKGANAEKFLEANVVLHNLRSTQTLGNVLGQTALSLMPEATKNVARSILKAGDEQEFTAKFLDMFSSMVNGTGIAPTAEARGFIGKIGDMTRGIFNFFSDMVSPGSFKDKRVKRKFFNWLKGENLLSNPEDWNGLEFFSDLRKVIEVKDGKQQIIDPFLMKDFTQQNLKTMENARFIAPGQGVRVEFDGVAGETLKQKDVINHEKIQHLQNGMDLTQASRANYGSREIVAYHHQIKKDPELQQFLVRMGYVSQDLMDKFLDARNLEGANVAGHYVNEFINQVSQALTINPMNNFQTGLGAFFQNNVTKNQAFINTLDPMIQKMTFYDEFAEKDRALDAIFNQLDKVFFDKESAGAVVDSLRASVRAGRTSDAARVQDVIDLWQQSTKKTIRNFNDTLDQTKALIDDGILDGGAMEDLHGQLKTFGLLDENVIAQNALGQEIIDGILAERRLFGADGVLPDDFKSLFADSGFDGLTQSAKDAIKQQVNKTVFANRTLSEALDLEQIQRLQNRAGPVVSKDNFVLGQPVTAENSTGVNQLVRIDPDQVKDLPPVARKYAGKYLPVDLANIITKGINMQDEAKKMSFLGKAFDEVINGLNEEEIAQRASANVKFLNKLAGKEVFGEGTLDIMERFWSGANFDYLTTLFKSQALLSPAFHVRNAISAFFTNTSMGVTTDDHTKAFRTLRAASKVQPGDVTRNADGSLRFGPDVRSEDKELLERFFEAEEAGILSGGLSGELREELGTQIRQGAATSINPLSAQNFFLYDKNFAVSGKIEDVARLAAFNRSRDSLQRSLQDSTEYTKLLHFDYNLLTPVEKKVLKRVIPFYTYFRKALARDSRLFMERTGEFVRMGHLVQEAERGIEPEESDALSQYVREQLGVRIRKNDRGKTEYLLLGGLIPAADLVARTVGAVEPGERLSPPAVLKNIANSFAEGLTPFLKLPAEQFLNLNFYFGKPIEKYQGELADLYGIAVPARYVHVIQSVRFLNDLNRVHKALRQVPSPVRPDVAPAGQDPSRAFTELMGVLGGVRVVENSSPATQLYFNRTLPQKQALQQARRNIRSEARKGPGNANLPVAVGVFQKTVSETQRKNIERQQARQRILQKSRRSEER